MSDLEIRVLQLEERMTDNIARLENLESGGEKERPSEPAKAEIQAKLAKTEQERDELKRQLAGRDGAAELTAKEHAEKMYSEWADDPRMGIFDFISHFEKHLLAYGKFAVRKAAGVESPEPKAEKVEPSEVERLRKRVHDLSGELSTVEVFLESKEELVYSQGKQIAKLGEELVSLKAQLAEATAPKSYTKVREIAAKLTKEMGLHSVSREIKYNTNEAEYDAVRLFDALVKNNLLATDEQLKLIEELRAENEKLINLHNP
jgi:hypothetical protein